METASFVVSVIALVLGVVAIPAVLQVVLGRPKLILGTDDFVGSDGKCLFVTITNEQTGKWLRWFGVERETGNVLAYFDISKMGSNELVSGGNAGYMTCTPINENGLLVRTLPGFPVAFAVICFRGDAASIVDAREEELQTLPAGLYLVRAQVICGERTFTLERSMRVGEEAHRTFWI